MFAHFKNPADNWPADQDFAAPPWANIFEHPGDYYDTEHFHLPVALQAPEQMLHWETLRLANYLLEARFTFRSKADIIRRMRHRKRDGEIAATAGDDEDTEDPPADASAESVTETEFGGLVTVDCPVHPENEAVVEVAEPASLANAAGGATVDCPVHPENEAVVEELAELAAPASPANAVGGKSKNDGRASRLGKIVAKDESAPAVRQHRGRKRGAEEANEGGGTGKKPRKVSVISVSDIAHPSKY
jgi:hypothetical protein